MSKMASSNQVDLRVEVYGNGAVEYCLHRPSDAQKSRLSVFWWCIASVSLASFSVWQAWCNAVVYVSVASALVALFMYKSAGTAIIQGR